MTSNDDRLPIALCLILMALISAILWMLIFLGTRAALAVDCERLPQLCAKSVASSGVKASRAAARTKVQRARAARTVTAQRRIKNYRKRVPVQRAAPLPAHPAAVANPTPLSVGPSPIRFTVADRIGFAHADILAIQVEDAPTITPVLVRTASHPPVAPQEAVRVIEAPYQATFAASEVRATWADHSAGKISIIATFLAIMAALALRTFKDLDVTRLKEISNARRHKHRAKSFFDRQTQALSRIGRRAKGICRSVADTLAERRRARKRIAEARQYEARAARAPAPYLPRAQERRRPYPVRYRAA